MSDGLQWPLWPERSLLKSKRDGIVKAISGVHASLPGSGNARRLPSTSSAPIEWCACSASTRRPSSRRLTTLSSAHLRLHGPVPQALMRGGSTTGAWERCQSPWVWSAPVNCSGPSPGWHSCSPLESWECPSWSVGVQELIQVHHFRRCWPPPTLQQGAQLQPRVHHPVDSGFLGILDLFLSDPPACLLPWNAMHQSSLPL